MILAITQRYEELEKEKHWKENFYINRYFKDVFEELDVLLIPVASSTQLEKIVSICDGLLLTGRGIDVNPKHYGEEAIEETNLSNNYEGEDELDFNLIKLFHKANKPILGICAGIQAINVYFGGSLYQDIPDHKSGEQIKMHPIKIEKGSFLDKCYGEETIEVNSTHHQAIKEVAANFKATATSQDGIIEAIEWDNIVGVQWHPEKAKDLEFFKKFLELYF